MPAMIEPPGGGGKASISHGAPWNAGSRLGHETETGWTSSAFTIAKRDAAGERWALAVAPSNVAVDP